MVFDTRAIASFRDLAGVLHQAVAGVAQSVVLVCAGLPLHFKSPPEMHEAGVGERR